jgi:hypothetical protein
MAFRYIICSACACIAVVSLNVNAAIKNADWKTPGDNLITQDTISGLEWLDLTATADRSYLDVSSQFGIGQEFEGWRYATAEEVTGFWDAFGGDSNYYNGLSTQNNGLFDLVAPYWGDLFCNYSYSSCNTGDGYSFAFTSEAFDGVSHMLALASDYNALPNYLTHDEFTPSYISLNDKSHYYDIGSALVRDISAVPIPAAIWLFSSGLLGLIGVARRKGDA